MRSEASWTFNTNPQTRSDAHPSKASETPRLRISRFDILRVLAALEDGIGAVSDVSGPNIIRLPRESCFG